jgi:hypothetical protein
MIALSGGCVPLLRFEEQRHQNFWSYQQSICDYNLTRCTAYRGAHYRRKTYYHYARRGRALTTATNHS